MRIMVANLMVTLAMCFDLKYFVSFVVFAYKNMFGEMVIMVSSTIDNIQRTGIFDSKTYFWILVTLSRPQRCLLHSNEIRVWLNHKYIVRTCWQTVPVLSSVLLWIPRQTILRRPWTASGDPTPCWAAGVQQSKTFTTCSHNVFILHVLPK